MSIIREGAHHIVFSITEDIISFLENSRIYCHEQKNNEPRRWKLNDKLTILKSTFLEPYICYRAGYDLCALGSFSYTGSQFPLNTQIGRYCSIAFGVRVMGWQHPVSAVTTNVLTCVPSIKWVKMAHQDLGINKDFDFVETPQKSAIKIGHDVWIGQDVLLSPGITIGTGAIIAAGSVVTKDVEPYAIMGGAKAQLIRYRFSGEIRSRLLESRWWEYNFHDLQQLDFSNPDLFLQRFERMKNELSPWYPPLINIYEYLKRKQ